MKFLLKQIQKYDHLFQKGGKLEILHPLWDAQNTFLFTPPDVTDTGPHVRDSIDLKRVMIMVVFALIPVVLFSFYNTGYQMARVYGEHTELLWWQLFANGAMVELPIILVSYAVGGLWEALFSTIRGHKISEGFLVTGILFPLTLPPTIPLWQVAVGVSFGVVIGKEIFGGTGMNILNPALTARVFLFFSFPIDISGNKPWIRTITGESWLDGFLFHKSALSPVAGYDTFSGATALLTVANTPAAQSPVAQLATNTFAQLDFWHLLVGLVPGSIGETSALMCLLGAVILIGTGVGSWRIMAGCVVGALGMASFLTLFAPHDPTSSLSGFLALPPYYHLVMGGFAFGAVYMATDPVSAAATETGKWIYGIAIGVLTILIRIWNPAYPEGMMLAILFFNIFAPLIDHFVVRGNIKRRMARAAR